VRGGLITPRRLAIVGVSLLSLVVCLGLAWWQWLRYESASGTWQNLGYVLQWPLFGLFPAFLFWRMRKLREQHAAAALAEPEPDPEPQAQPWVPPPPRVPARQDDEDPVLAEYNRYLAQLNAQDQETR
jgi:DNA-binding transcriptional regulator of glucitol operon